MAVNRIYLIFLLGLWGCNNCDVGATWCEDDAVMICVADETADDDGDAWDEDDDSGSLGIALIFAAADNDTHVEVLDACHERDQICEEQTDDEGETVGECDWPVGTGWMY